jgi:hypothetical protein
MPTKYRILFDCPDDKRLINRLIDVASKAGAGKLGHYSRCATVLKGWNTWKSEKGARPHIGKVGKISRVPSVRVEMTCEYGKIRKVCRALREAHPYEEPFIQVVRLLG